MGIENAIQEAGDKGITVFEYFWEAYPLYTFLILFGFFILIILALLPKRTVHVYEEPYEYSPQNRQREVVIHHSAPQRQTDRQSHVVHVYDDPEPVYDEPIQEQRRKRFTMNNLDLTDNYGFLD